MKSQRLLVLPLFLLLGSCAPSKEEALQYYENILSITTPAIDHAIHVTAHVVLCTVDDFKEDEKTNQENLAELKKSNHELRKYLSDAIVKIDSIPRINTSLDMKNLIAENLKSQYALQNMIADSIIARLYMGPASYDADVMSKNSDYAIAENRELCSTYFGILIEFEKECRIYEFERKAIEKKYQIILKDMLTPGDGKE